LAPSVLSPELVLVDPTLLREMRGLASGPAAEMTPEEQMNGEAMHVNGSNGATPAQALGVDTSTQPSVETILFKAGLITADQLGEVVLERVQSGRSAGEIVVERGLVSPEALAGAIAGLAAPAADPAHAPVAEPVHAPVAEAVAAPVPEAAAAPAPVVEAPVVEALAVEAAVVEAPAPMPVVTVPEPVAPMESIAPPAPEPVEAAVVAPAPVEPAPVEPATELAQPQPEPEPVPAPPAAVADEPGISTGEVQYGIRIRLSEGVTLEAGSYPSREQAIEVARGISVQLAAEGGEWPLVGDTLVRPDAVLAIEIESAVSWFSSGQA
jgi:hypothetical protein